MSDEQDKDVQTPQAEGQETPECGESRNVEELGAEVERLQALYEKENDLHLRAVAELRNFRRRTMEERVAHMQYATQELMTALLPALDHLDMALKAYDQSEDAGACMTGVQMTQSQLHDVLAQFGLQTIEAEGMFDPEVHEAIERVESDSQCEGTIVGIGRTGYKLNDRVLRPAQVKVAVEPGPG